MQALIKVDHNTWKATNDINKILEAEEFIDLGDADNNIKANIERLNEHLGNNRFTLHSYARDYEVYEGILVEDPAEAVNYPESIDIYCLNNCANNVDWIKNGCNTIYKYVSNPKERIKRAKAKTTREQNKKSKPPSQNEIKDALRTIEYRTSKFNHNGDILDSTYNIIIVAIANKRTKEIIAALKPIAQRWVSNQEKAKETYEPLMDEHGYKLFNYWCKKAI